MQTNQWKGQAAKWDHADCVDMKKEKLKIVDNFWVHD